MKTIKTAAGFKKITVQEEGLLVNHLREIIHEHRSILINKLILGGVQTYITYKFNKKAGKEQLQKIEEQLYDLKNSGFGMDRYHHILDQVLKNDFVTLEKKIFYTEIDKVVAYELGVEETSIV